MQNDLINLRVSKNDVINQINISTEGILIAGNKIRITGTTTIDNSVIKTAMISDLAVTTAKIANLSISAAKIADAAITNAIQTLTGSSSIRITGTTISYYNGSSLTSQINSNGIELTREVGEVLFLILNMRATICAGHGNQVHQLLPILQN